MYTFSHCDLWGHISIDVSIKSVVGLEQALIILQFNRETDHVKWQVSSIFLEQVSKFTQYTSLPYTGIFIVCLFYTGNMPSVSYSWETPPPPIQTRPEWIRMRALEWTNRSNPRQANSKHLYTKPFPRGSNTLAPRSHMCCNEQPSCSYALKVSFLHWCSNTSATQLGAFLRTMSSGFLTLNLSLGPLKYTFSDGAYPVQWDA